MQSATVADLPCEVIASILKNLDNIHSVLPCILVSRKFYLSYQEHPSIKKEIVVNHITPSLLPYAVAVRAASHLPKPLSAASIDKILDIIYAPQAQLNAHQGLDEMILDDLLHMVRMHDIIQNLVIEFADSAWSILSPDDTDLSTSEYFRFSRAFYRFELLCSLFSYQSPLFSDLEDSKAKSQFLSRHAPWENEQIGCIHDFLERKMSKDLHEVLSHDIQFGDLRVNYLAYGSDNHWKQVWLSQGIEFIHYLKNKSFDEIRFDLPHSIFGPSVRLYDELNTEYDSNIEDSGLLLHEFSQAEVDSLNPHEDSADTDTGPLEAWHLTHLFRSRYSFVMFPGDDWLRKKAYVLWDSSRLHSGLHSSNVLEMLNDSPEERAHDHSRAEWDAMNHSWTERSRIWQQGGSGYWANGDLSKIIWSGSAPGS